MFVLKSVVVSPTLHPTLPFVSVGLYNCTSEPVTVTSFTKRTEHRTNVSGNCTLRGVMRVEDVWPVYHVLPDEIFTVESPPFSVWTVSLFSLEYSKSGFQLLIGGVD